ncbi:hypothetical protein AGMMS50249_4050 [candidate division SR1 bacterium]|nr:hypothetical protein AGMMS50249_4050 [candidate division SR1 bacterium]
MPISSNPELLNTTETPSTAQQLNELKNSIKTPDTLQSDESLTRADGSRLEISNKNQKVLVADGVATENTSTLRFSLETNIANKKGIKRIVVKVGDKTFIGDQWQSGRNGQDIGVFNSPSPYEILKGERIQVFAELDISSDTQLNNPALKSSATTNHPDANYAIKFDSRPYGLGSTVQWKGIRQYLILDKIYTVGIETINLNIKVHGANGVLTIENNDQPQTFEIYNTQGQLVYSETVSGTQQITTLPTGAYLIRVGSQTYKVMI